MIHIGQKQTLMRSYRENPSGRPQISIILPHIYMDNKSRIIVGSDMGRPDKKTDCENALVQLRRIKWTYKMKPESLGADKGYAAGAFIHNLINEDINPHIPILDYRSKT